MSPENLLLEIQKDTIAYNLAKEGDDSNCAKRLVEILPKIQIAISSIDVMTIAARNGKWGKIALICTENSFDFQLRIVCKTLIDWVGSGKSIDLTLQSVKGMISVLLQADLIDERDIKEITDLSWTFQSISSVDVSQAMQPLRIDGKI